jgi:hypothetical protein
LARISVKAIDAVGEATSTVTMLAGEVAQFAGSIVGEAVSSVGDVLSKRVEEGVRILGSIKK